MTLSNVKTAMQIQVNWNWIECWALAEPLGCISDYYHSYLPSLSNRYLSYVSMLCHISIWQRILLFFFFANAVFTTVTDFCWINSSRRSPGCAISNFVTMNGLMMLCKIFIYFCLNTDTFPQLNWIELFFSPN